MNSNTVISEFIESYRVFCGIIRVAGRGVLRHGRVDSPGAGIQERMQQSVG